VPEDAARLLPDPELAVIATGWRQGMSASLRAGLRSVDRVRPEPDAVLVHLVDLPDVTAEVVARLVAGTDGPKVLARAVYGGRPGTSRASCCTCARWRPAGRWTCSRRRHPCSPGASCWPREVAILRQAVVNRFHSCLASHRLRRRGQLGKLRLPQRPQPGRKPQARP
jgi:MobA-like NTP transferase protein